MRGVAVNPAAPADVLLRLLDPAGRPSWKVLGGQRRVLPQTVIDAIIAHPEPRVRIAFARNPFADPAQRGRLADDRSQYVRLVLAKGPHYRAGWSRPLPDEVVAKFFTAEFDDSAAPVAMSNAGIVQELVLSGQIRGGFYLDAAQHADPRLRAWATNIWPLLSPQQRAALLADPDAAVRERARRASRIEDPEAMAADLPDAGHQRAVFLANFAVSPAVAQGCFAVWDLLSLADNPFTPADVVAKLARDPDPHVRERVASRSAIDASLLAQLAEDDNSMVRLRARIHRLPRTEAQRNAIDRIVGCSAEEIGRVGEMIRLPGPQWYADCAASGHPLLRRVAATCPGLPATSLAMLVEDPDAQVRYLLAFNHPDAPAQLLVEAFIACPRQRTFLLTLAQMPRTGLAQLANHPDAQVRALAAADPAIGEQLGDLLTDPDLHVRRAAAANPAASMTRINALLQDPDLAEAAASNPQLSAEQLHALLDEAGIARLPASNAAN